jgi:hypothetical protein
MKNNLLHRPKFTLCTKQYVYIALAALSVFLAVVSHVRAEEAASGTVLTTDPIVEENRPGMPAERRGALEAAQGARTERLEEQREVKRAALSTNLQARILNLVENVAARMRAAISRLVNIADRMETRMEKLEMQGVDTTAAESLVKDAQVALERSAEILDNEVPRVSSALVGDSPRESFRAIREQFATAQADIVAARDSLHEALAHLKEAVRAAELGRGSSDAVRANPTPLSTEETNDDSQVEDTLESNAE